MTNDPTREILDNVDLDLTGTELRRPIIDKQSVLSTVKECFWEAKTTKAGEKAKQLVIVLVTADVAISTTGKSVNPGHETEVTIWATPSGGLTQAMINQKVARFQTAALASDEPGPFRPADMIGRSVKAYYEAEPDKRDPSVVYQRVSRWEKAS